MVYNLLWFGWLLAIFIKVINLVLYLNQNKTVFIDSVERKIGVARRKNIASDDGGVQSYLVLLARSRAGF